MDALLVYNWILHEELARCQRSGLSNFWLVMVQIRQRARAHKLVQNVSSKVKRAQGDKCECDELWVLVVLRGLNAT